MRKKKYALTIAIITLSSFIIFYVFNEKKNYLDINMQPYTIPENCDFNAVIEGGFGRNGGGIRDSNSCSPEITGYDYAGIVINAPKEIIFSSESTENDENALPICGTFADALGTFVTNTRSLVHSIVIVVVDTKTNQSWSGKIPEMQNQIRRPKGKNERKKPLTAEELKGRTIGGYFNPNLFNITSMPLRETEYIVYATVGPYKSNVVTIKATKSK